MKWLIVPVLALASLFLPTSVQAQDWNHRHYHNDLQFRQFQRYEYHQDAHRYPMTWWQHQELHDTLRHDAYHDRLEHRQYHRYYAPYNYYNGSGYYSPGYNFGYQSPGFSFWFGR